MIATWNAAFKEVEGGHHASAITNNLYEAIRIWRWNAGRAHEDQVSPEAFEAAIRGYATNPANVALRSFKRFAPWFAEAEERVPDELKRIAWKPRDPAADARAAQQASLAAQRAGVQRIIEESVCFEHCMLAATIARPLRAVLETALASVTVTGRAYEKSVARRRQSRLRSALEFLDRFVALPKDVQSGFYSRAKTSFIVVHQCEPGLDSGVTCIDFSLTGDGGWITGCALALYEHDLRSGATP